MQEWLVEAYAHAEKEFPKESCGVVISSVGNLLYYPCRNQAAKTDHFCIHPGDLALALDEGTLVEIVHSHPGYGPNPSHADKTQMEQHGVPWTIISWPGKIHKTTNPSGWKAPLVGREFSIGILDCYTIIKDHFEWKLGIHLNDYPREDRFWERDERLYRNSFAREGFIEVDPDTLQENDCFLMTLRSKIENHAAVFLGYRDFNGRAKVPVILHHIQDNLSSEDVYGGWFEKNTTVVLRHKDLFK